MNPQHYIPNGATYAWIGDTVVLDAPPPLFYTQKLLQFDRPRYHPWLTVPLVEQEMARQDYQADKIQMFEDSL